MLRRYYSTHVPVEIARTFLTIAETRSFSKAGEKLGLSQPAISAQVKRLQTIVGGPVFDKQNTGGLTFTPRGQSALLLARKLIEVNDQIVSLGGTHKGRPAVRVGVSYELAQRLLQAWAQKRTDAVLHVHSCSSSEVVKGVSEGFFDVGCLLGEHGGDEDIVEEWMEPLVWARHPHFVASPGSPIPVVGWPGGCIQKHVERCFERHSIAYRTVFATPDHMARLAAVESCIGVAAFPAWRMARPLIAAGDFYLPTLPPIKGAIVVRNGLASDTVSEVRPLWTDFAAARVS
ncbi:MAG TPA: LysR family transcriptional regulator [Pseudolabrys sp.]|nr:LysR family transcriptional regulator [Pseudolabrys sp.]